MKHEKMPSYPATVECFVANNSIAHEVIDVAGVRSGFRGGDRDTQGVCNSNILRYEKVAIFFQGKS